MRRFLRAASELYVIGSVAEAIGGSDYRVEPVAAADLQGIGEVALFRVVRGQA